MAPRSPLHIPDIADMLIMALKHCCARMRFMSEIKLERFETNSQRVSRCCKTSIQHALHRDDSMR